MTREESIKLLALIKVAYPTAFKDMDNDTKHATVAMWQSTFPNTPYVIMEMAFDRFRRVSKFPPTVAEMYEQLRALYYGAVQDAITAFNSDEIKKKARIVMAHTEIYRGDFSYNGINYAAVDNLIVAPEDKPALNEGGETYEA